MCRLKYKNVPKKLPKTVEGMANYWKKYFTSRGIEPTPFDLTTYFNLPHTTQPHCYSYNNEKKPNYISSITSGCTTF